MVYKKGFVAVVECNGKILRETNVEGEQVVTLPFMSDYSLLLKNKEARRAQVRVEIDGRDVLSGNSLNIAPNSEVRLEGFLEGNVVRNKFRFIRKTLEVVEHRGDRIDDGIIRIEFRYEKLQPEEQHIYHYDHYHYWGPWVLRYPAPIVTWVSTGIVDVGSTAAPANSVDCSGTTAPTSTISGTYGTCMLDASQPRADEGITVPGRQTHQTFNPAYMGPLEANSHVIVIRLCGATQESVPVTQPITVSDKLVCSSCGAKWPSDHKFCGRCGTALI